jgi:hypothetical protein
MAQLASAAVKKIERLGMDGFADTLPRNLMALLHQRH